KVPLRILVAEDNVVNQKVATSILQRMGYRPDVVSNGLEVLTALEQIPYDLVLMDVQMPEMDGLATTKHICEKYGKQLDHRPVIVAMTAGAMNGDRELCLETGMDDYISKPVKLQTLQKILVHWGARILQNQNSILAVPQGTSHLISQSLPPNSTNVSQDEQAINWQILTDIRQQLQIQGQPDLVTDLINSFIKDAEEMFVTMKQTIDEFESETLKLTAHSLKGVCGNLGIVSMAKIAAAIEEKAKFGLIAEAEQLLIQLENEFVKIKSLLQEFRV
ncbi:MAG: response regulator, partial [Trichodesmium sp.]